MGQKMAKYIVTNITFVENSENCHLCNKRAKVTIYNCTISLVELRNTFTVPRHRLLNLLIIPIKTECRVQKCWVDHWRFLHPSLSSEYLNILSRFKTLWTCFVLCRIVQDQDVSSVLWLRMIYLTVDCKCHYYWSF